MNSFNISQSRPGCQLFPPQTAEDFGCRSVHLRGLIASFATLSNYIYIQEAIGTREVPLSNFTTLSKFTALNKMVSHTIITYDLLHPLSREITRPIHQSPIILLPWHHINNPPNSPILLPPPPIRIGLFQVFDCLIPFLPLQLLQPIKVSCHACTSNISHDCCNTFRCSREMGKFSSPEKDSGKHGYHDGEDGEGGDAPEEELAAGLARSVR
jgi:hypothetical protein